MADMPKKLPPHVVRQTTRHSKSVLYFRKGKGPRIRLPDDPASAEFMMAYVAAMKVGADGSAKQRRTDASKQSLRWLIERYMESSSWASLSPGTRRQRSNIFKDAVTKAGSEDFQDITASSLRKSMEARAKTPARANDFRKAMRGLFQWALINDHVEVDPTAGVERIEYKSDGYEAWTIEDAKLYCEKWPIGTKERLALELDMFSGLRRSDLCVAGKQHLRGNVFQMKTGKTGAIVTVEFPQRLIDIISATACGDLHFIVGEGGNPFTPESFGNWFRKNSQAAGIKKPLHGVRKLAATMAANSGASAHELMAQFGWATPRQAEVYTKGADRVRLGISSSRRVAEQIEGEISPHLTPGTPYLIVKG